MQIVIWSLQIVINHDLDPRAYYYDLDPHEYYTLHDCIIIKLLEKIVVAAMV